MDLGYAENIGASPAASHEAYDPAPHGALLILQDLVKLLDALFLCFDKLSEQFQLVKIETVFETYLAAAGKKPNLTLLTSAFLETDSACLERDAPTVLLRLQFAADIVLAAVSSHHFTGVHI